MPLPGVEAGTEILARARKIPDLVKRIPTPRQNPGGWLYLGAGFVGAFAGEALLIHANDEATKQKQAQTIIDAQKKEQQKLYDAIHNPPPVALPDGKIQTNINQAGEVLVTRIQTHYSSLDAKPQEDSLWKISTDPKLIYSSQRRDRNMLYLRAISKDAAQDGIDFVTFEKGCTIVGMIGQLDSEGIVERVIPIENPNCLRPVLPETA